MRFSFWPIARQSWDDVLTLARHVERTGWDGVWYADHFMPNTPDASDPCHEAWTTVAALAASVPRVRIGTLVAGNTYRHPAVVANMAATIDHISGGLRSEGPRQNRMAGRIRSRPGRNVDLRALVHE